MFKRYINHPVKTETMAHLMRWVSRSVLGQQGSSCCFLCGMALAERALHTTYNDGQCDVDPSLRYYWDAVAEVRLAIRNKNVRVSHSQEYLEVVG